jgi:hypothetical protein
MLPCVSCQDIARGPPPAAEGALLGARALAPEAAEVRSVEEEIGCLITLDR